MRFTSFAWGLTFASFISSSALAYDGSLGLEYGSISIKAKGGKAIDLPSYRLNMFDTTGGLTAGIRGALNQNAAQKAKEYQIEQAARNGSTPDGVVRSGDRLYGTYSYSWEQPAPTPTDGDRWTLTAATNGTPILDAVSAPSSSDKTVNSLLGIEFSSALWSYTSAPLSFSAGWGMKFFMFSSDGPNSGGGVDSNSVSIPIDLTVSSQLYKGLTAYGNVAVSPISVFKGKGYYLHEEIGLNWIVYEDWLLTLNYRSTQDSLSDKDADGDPIEYQMQAFHFGIGYVF